MLVKDQTTPATQEAKMAALLASMWTKNRPLMLERLGTLDRAAEAAELAELEPELRETTIGIAHKLAGSLGTFGFPRGTELARELELALESAHPEPKHLKTLVMSLRLTLFPETLDGKELS
jgi:HPt (histidine-containing phosphotransfer) domain-containing protein